MPQSEAEKLALHLWEVEHPYYMNEGNYFKAGCHETYPTWDAFEAGWRDADMDYNWFVRWDWLEGEDSGAGAFTGDIYYRNGILMLQHIGQRKSYLGSHEVSVCRADEPRVIAFLSPYWTYMQSMWAPFTTPQPEAKEAHTDAWPNGCHSPNSCTRHMACMYTNCRHENRSIKAEIEAALKAKEARDGTE